VEGSLSAYSPRLLIYDVPEAPAGYDLGQGNVQLRPPYRAGYKLEIGSDYNLLVIGRLVDRNGEPVSLLAGTATDLGAPKRPAVTMFTARNGRFGAQGLRAGRWRIEMPTEPPTIYEIEVRDDPSGTVRLGDVRPLEQGKGE
jgi:outer membrane usher protein